MEKSQSKDPAKYSGTLAGLDRILERCYNASQYYLYHPFREIHVPSEYSAFIENVQRHNR